MNAIWYLSPSCQPENVGIGDYGNEQEQMYRLTEEIIPHLERCGVSFLVAGREETLSQRCRNSNVRNAGYHLALHSNAGGGGKAWGPIAFYYAAGKPLAEKLIHNLLQLGQENNRSENLQKNTNLYELRHAAAPAVLLEVDFHDSVPGVNFLTQRRSEIAQAIAKAIVEEDGKQWVEPRDHVPSDTEEVEALGLFLPDEQGNYHWNQTLFRKECAEALLRLKKIMEKRGE